MSYYLETARPAMLKASELLGELATRYKTDVSGATGALGSVDWPLMMFFCVGPYNESLRWTRDAAADAGEGVNFVSETLKNIVEVYEQLEQNGIVK